MADGVDEAARLGQCRRQVEQQRLVLDLLQRQQRRAAQCPGDEVDEFGPAGGQFVGRQHRLAFLGRVAGCVEAVLGVEGDNADLGRGHIGQSRRGWWRGGRFYVQALDAIDDHLKLVKVVGQHAGQAHQPVACLQRRQIGAVEVAGVEDGHGLAGRVVVSAADDRQFRGDRRGDDGKAAALVRRPADDDLIGEGHAHPF